MTLSDIPPGREFLYDGKRLRRLDEPSFIPVVCVDNLAKRADFSSISGHVSRGGHRLLLCENLYVELTEEDLPPADSDTLTALDREALAMGGF